MASHSSRCMAALAALVCGAVIGTSVSPALAAEPSPGESAVVGAFSIGDDLEATISERDGAFELGFDVGGLGLKWDSRDAADDRYGIGPGWRWGFGGGIQIAGGVEVRRASGGTYPIDPTHPTGLAGYGVLDTRFDHAPGVLDARPGSAGAGSGSAGEVEYEYVLHELGGEVSYFDARGEPVAQVTATGQRTEWRWDDLVPHRLLGVVDPDGVELEFDWEREAGAVLVRPGSNLPPEAAGDGLVPVAPVWRLEVDGGRLASIMDPVGGATSIEYDATTGLVSQVAGRSDAVTEVAWRVADDGIPRVETVRTRDALGHELSRRSWAAVGDGTMSSGWPIYGGERDVFWSNDPSFRYSTELSDGATRVRSEYNSLHELVGRHVVATTASGDVTLREQAFTYPGTEDGGVPDPAGLPGNWSRPIRSEMTYRDAYGGSRTTTETFAFDELGRVVTRTAVDGTRTESRYDEVVPDGATLPVGLETEQVVTATDGLVQRTERTLNHARTAAVAVEVSQGRTGGTLTTTARAEFEVDADGFVREQRMYPVEEPGHPAPPAAPTLTVWDRSVDLGTGLMTTTETLGAGTAAEATTSTITSLRHGGDVRQSSPAGAAVTSWFDELGRVTRTTYPDGSEIVHEYDAHGRRLATIDVALDRTEYSYDAVGLLSRIAQRDAAGEPRAAVSYSYDPYGRVSTLARDNGVVTEIGYTSASEIAAETTRAHGRLQTERRYEYDVRGNLIQREDERHDADGSASRATTRYEYDAFDRLIRSTHDEDSERDGPSTLETSYEVSPSGDVTAEVSTRWGADGASRLERRFEYSPLGELTATAVADAGGERREHRRYDTAGNLVDDGTGRTFEYNAANRLIGEVDADGNVQRTTYWSDGTRRSVERVGADGESTESTTFYWEGAALRNEVRTAGTDTETATYLLGGARHARTVIGDWGVEASYFGSDRHGNITEVTAIDGTLTMAYAYTDYGSRTPVVGEHERPAANPFGYAGEYTNEDGTQSLGERIYDPATMRFTTMDTADLHNTYAYADLNPVTTVDPSGRTGEPDGKDHWAVIGVAIASFFLSLASMVFAPPVGIMKAITLGFMMGDVFAMAVGATQMTVPDGLSDETKRTLDGIEDGFTAVAAVGIIFAIGRFVFRGMQRMIRQDIRDYRIRKSTMDGWSSEDGENFKHGLKVYIADADEGAAHFTSTHTPDGVRHFVEQLTDFIWRSPAVGETKTIESVSPTFWLQFAKWTRTTNPKGFLPELVEKIAEWYYGPGTYQLVRQVEEARNLAKVLASSYTMKLPPSAAWGPAFADVRWLSSEVHRADRSLPLAYPPIKSPTDIWERRRILLK